MKGKDLSKLAKGWIHSSKGPVLAALALCSPGLAVDPGQRHSTLQALLSMGIAASRVVVEYSEQARAVKRKRVAAVFEGTGTLMSSFIGQGHYLYVAGTCKTLAVTYATAMKGLLNSRQVHVLKDGTTYAAALSSASCLQLAAECGLLTQPQDYKLSRIAGRLADLTTLQLAAELGLNLNGDVVRGAVTSGSIEKLRWLHAEGAPFGQGAMHDAAALGSISVLQYLFSIGCPCSSHATTAAAEHGNLHAFNLLVVRGCPVDAERIAAAAIKGGNVALMELVRREYNMIFLDEATETAAYLGHAGALAYLFTERGCHATEYTWYCAVEHGSFDVLQCLLDHSDIRPEPLMHAHACAVHDNTESLAITRWLHETVDCAWDPVELAKAAML